MSIKITLLKALQVNTMFITSYIMSNTTVLNPLFYVKSN